jgi:DNA polymerase-3 subunit beta
VVDEGVEQVALHTVSGGQMLFVAGDTKIMTRIIDGEYPPYERIIPKTHNTSCEIDTDELLKAVKSASIFARDNANIVRLEIGKEGVRIQANTPQVGENTIDVDAKVEGEGGQIAFNSRFLIDFLSGPAKETVVFKMTGSLNPGEFRNKGEDNFLHIIMPVRVQS